MAATVNDTAGQRAPAITPESSAGVMAEVRSLVNEFRGLAADHVKLAALEAKQAGASLGMIVALGVLAAIFLLSAWLGLMGAVALFLVERALLTGSAALGLAVAVNLVLVLVLGVLMYRRRNQMTFAATARSLKALFADQTDKEGF